MNKYICCLLASIYILMPLNISALINKSNTIYIVKAPSYYFKKDETMSLALSEEQALNTPEMIKFDSQALSKFIKDEKKDICKGVKDVDVKIWAAIDTTGSIAFFSASLAGGLEVIFHCK